MTSTANILFTRDIGPHRAAYLDLEYQASEPYTSFVYDNPEQARHIADTLFERNACEFASPHAELLIDPDGEPLGMLAALTARDLQTCRLRAALVLRKSGILAEHPEVERRLPLAGQTLLKLEATDFYLSRLAVAPAARGRGLGTVLLNHFETLGRRQGCRRLVLEVHPANAAAVALYSQSGFQELARPCVHDAVSGRSLGYIHMAKVITCAPDAA